MGYYSSMSENKLPLNMEILASRMVLAYELWSEIKRCDHEDPIRQELKYKFDRLMTLEPGEREVVLNIVKEHVMGADVSRETI